MVLRFKTYLILSGIYNFEHTYRFKKTVCAKTYTNLLYLICYCRYSGLFPLPLLHYDYLISLVNTAAMGIQFVLKHSRS